MAKITIISDVKLNQIIDSFQLPEELPVLTLSQLTPTMDYSQPAPQPTSTATSSPPPPTVVIDDDDDDFVMEDYIRKRKAPSSSSSTTRKPAAKRSKKESRVPRTTVRRSRPSTVEVSTPLATQVPPPPPPTSATPPSVTPPSATPPLPPPADEDSEDIVVIRRFMTRRADIREDIQRDENRLVELDGENSRLMADMVVYTKDIAEVDEQLRLLSLRRANLDQLLVGSETLLCANRVEAHSMNELLLKKRERLERFLV